MNDSGASKRTVFFDLGKVLIAFDWTPALTAVATRVAVSPQELGAWILGPEGPHEDYCRGAMSDHEMLGAIHRRFDPTLLLNDDWLFDQWCSIFSPMPGAIELVDELDGRCHRGLVSNTNHLHFEWLDELLGLRTRFESVTLSHELGCLKPEPGIYEAALNAAACSPEQAIFIDDLAENVAAAEAMGMRGVRFEGVDGLRSVLADEGLLPSS